jgi:hypothetical protein
VRGAPIRRPDLFGVFRVSGAFGALGILAGLGTTVLVGCGSSAPGAGSNPDADASATIDAGQDGDATGSTDGAASDGPFSPAPHPALPRVLNSGGPVLAAPKVLPILFAGDTGAIDVENFLGGLQNSEYWFDATSEYGVGALTALPSVMMAGTAPATISDAALQAAVVANTSGTNPLWGAADPSTVYLFALPQGTIESDAGGACCTDYGGYHSETTAGAVPLPYAVICTCPGFDGPGSVLDGRTIAMSHELVESATDPFPNTNPAYLYEDDADLVWKIVTGGEVADMCELNEDAFFAPPGSRYVIQRVWSNAAAAAFQDPCVPERTTAPYFNTFPALGTISYGPASHAFATQAVNIPIGQTETIALNLSSAAPTAGVWSVKVYDANYLKGGAANLALALDSSKGQNGDTLHLTITPMTVDPRVDGETFVILSEHGTPGTSSFQNSVMMGLVTN